MGGTALLLDRYDQDSCATRREDQQLVHIDADSFLSEMILMRRPIHFANRPIRHAPQTHSIARWETLPRSIEIIRLTDRVWLTRKRIAGLSLLGW